jgi:IclR family pca regulon transcriptional regulator
MRIDADEGSPLHEDPEAVPADTAESASKDAEGASAADPNYMNSLARGLAVILAFTHARRSLSISQISQRTGIPRAAVRRCLFTLEQLGYVAREDARHFVLRPRVLSLGHTYLASAPLGRAAQPVLQAIRHQINESASVGILDNDQVLYIARAPADRLMVINLDVGSRLPANCTSIGRVLLSYLAPAALDEHIGRVPLVKYRPKTLVTAEALKAELARVRAQGYALIDQELEIGLRTIAVPILNGAGQATAALSVGTHVARQSIPNLTERVLPVLKDAAAELALLARR